LIVVAELEEGYRLSFMGKYEKLLLRILGGQSDANIPFDDLCQLLRRHGFEERTQGSHRIFVRAGIARQVVLQPQSGKAKRYQVKQVRELFEEFQLGGEGDE
jgi:predicted RNA binding protein YcfA (HicA-like mRNA interferase family)